MGAQKKNCPAKKNLFLFFLRPPLNGALGGRLYRLYEKPPLHTHTHTHTHTRHTHTHTHISLLLDFCRKQH